jgi:ComF family protein
MAFLKKIFSAAADLFYPHICLGCAHDLTDTDQLLCMHCINDLPHTGFEKYALNKTERIFYGRLPLRAAHSEYYFSKGGLIQQLIHEFKYRGNRDIGICLSELMGTNMLLSGRFRDIDCLVPLPLYAEKEYKRGYNQAAVSCTGISNSMNIPVYDYNLVRRYATETQTRKHRAERWDNVSGSFNILRPDSFQNKHILLVDDVVTTGATLEAAALMLLNIPGATISIATLTIAGK